MDRDVARMGGKGIGCKGFVGEPWWKETTWKIKALMWG